MSEMKPNQNEETHSLNLFMMEKINLRASQRMGQLDFLVVVSVGS